MPDLTFYRADMMLLHDILADVAINNPLNYKRETIRDIYRLRATIADRLAQGLHKHDTREFYLITDEDEAIWAKLPSGLREQSVKHADISDQDWSLIPQRMRQHANRIYTNTLNL